VILQFLASLALLAANAFFVAVEFALVGARRTKLEPLAEEGRRSARLALDAVGRLNLQLAGAQLGITMASLLLGYVAEPLAEHLLAGALGVTGLPDGARHALAVGIGLTVVVFLHMVLGEMVPKNIAIAAPERTLLLLALPNRAYLWLFRPVIAVLNVLAVSAVRLLRVEPRDELAASHTAEELALMVAESHEEGLIEDFAHDLLAGVLDFGGTTAGEVMVPRSEIVSIARTTSAADIEALVVERGYSRLPVFAATADEPLGFVHSKDLLSLPVDAADRPVPAPLVRPLPVVGVDSDLEAVLRTMRRTRVHVALVADGAGTTVGLVTLEDLLEELVGDILDETDAPEAGAAEAEV
jgi:CBS domain containing-hemolysin-like protein